MYSFDSFEKANYKSIKYVHLTKKCIILDVARRKAATLLKSRYAENKTK